MFRTKKKNRFSKLKKVTAWFTLCLYLLQPTLAVAADVVADPNAGKNKQPVVDKAANGTTVVQIAKPSAAGISHNLYQQFNVNPQGLILNNARLITQTQLAGYITGNPNLAGGSARIILNEVTGATPSYLRGYTEIAGAKADLILANPNGIVGNGFGFINAGRTTLTTGIPVFGGSGSLEAFRVTGGQIAVEGSGLDGTGVDKVDLISQTASVNAGVWAKELNVITGNNEVKYNNLNTQKLDNNAGTQVALDVGQLGGMYANKIRLVGTAQGLGVNSQGTISALGGDLELNQTGKIILAGNTAATGNTLITANDGISNQGNLASGRNTVISTPGTLTNTGAMIAGQHTTITADTLNSSGAVGAGINTDGSVGTSGDLWITTNKTATLTGQNLAAGKLTVRGGTLDLSGAQSYAGGDVSLTAFAGDIKHIGGSLRTPKTVAMTALKTVANDKDNSGTAGQITANKVVITAQDISNKGGVMTQTGSDITRIDAKNKLDNTGGSIATNSSGLTLAGNAIDNTHGQIIHAGNDKLTLQPADKLTNTGGKILTNGQLTVSAATVDSTGGTIYARQAADINSRQLLNDHGAITANGAMKITAKNELRNEQGIIEAGKGLAVATHSIENQGGSITSLDNSGLAVSAAETIDNRAGTLGGNGNVNIIAQDVNNTRGNLIAGGALSANVAGITDNTGGAITAWQDITFGKAQLISNLKQGSIKAGRNLSLNAATLTSQGTITAAQNIKLQADHFLNDSNAALASGASLEILINNDFTNNGGITGGILDVRTDALHNSGTLVADSLTVSSHTLKNTGSGANITANKTAAFTAAAIDNADGAVIYNGGGSGALNIKADKLTNSGVIASGSDANFTVQSMGSTGTLGAGVKSDGTLGTAGNLSLLSTGLVTANGKNLAAGNIKISGTGIDQSKALTFAGGNVDITAGLSDINNAGGLIQAAGTVTLQAAGVLQNDKVSGGSAGQILGNKVALLANDISNQGGSILQTGSADTEIKAVNGLNNFGGAIETNGLNLLITANTLTNEQGKIVHAGTGQFSLNLQNDFTNKSGSIATNGLTGIRAENVDSTSGKISSAQGLSLQAASLNNDQGSIAAGAAINVILQNSLSNQQGIMEAAKEVAINAASLNNQSGSITSLDASQMTVNILEKIDNTAGIIGGNGNVRLTAQDFNSTNGKLIAGAGLTANVLRLDNTGGTISAQQDIAFNKAALVTNINQGSITAGGNLVMNAGTLNNNQGTLFACNDLTIAGDSVIGGRVLAGRDLSITVADRLQQLAGGEFSANQSASITADSIISQGNIAAVKNLQVHANNLVNEHGAKLAGGAALALTINDKLTNAGSIVGSNLDMHTSLLNNNGTILSDVLTIAGDTVNNTGASAGITANNAANLTATAAFHNLDGAVIYNGGTTGALTVTANNVINSGTVISGSDANFTVQNITSTGSLGAGIKNDGTLGTVGGLSIVAAGLANVNGKNLAAGDLLINAAAVDISGAVTYAGGQADITAKSGDVNNAGGALQAAGAMTVSAAGTLKNDKLNDSVGQIIGDKVMLAANDINNQGGRILQTGSAATQITAANTIDNTGGSLETNGLDLSITANLFQNDQGRILHAGTGLLSLTAQQELINNAGSIATNGAVSLAAESIGSTGGKITAVHGIEMQAGSLDNKQGSIIAGDALRITLQTGLENRLGIIEAGKSLAIAAQNINNQAGSITSLDKSGMEVNVRQKVNNSGGTLGGNGDVKLAAQDANSANGKLIAGGNLTASIAGLLDNTGGVIAARQDINIGKAAAITNTQGNISTGGNIFLTAELINNTGGNLTAGQSIALAGNNIIGGGKAVAGQDLTITATGSFDHLLGGDFAANRDVTIAADAFTSAGSITAVRNLELTAGSIQNDSGAKLAGGAVLKLKTDGQLSNKGIVSGRLLKADARKIDNSGTIAADMMTMSADTVSNTGGASITANRGAAITALAAMNNNVGAVLYGGADGLTIQTNTLTNNGAIAANGNTGITAQTITSDGTLGAGLKADGTANTAGNLGLAATGTVTITGKNVAAGDISVTGASIDQHKATAIAGGNVTVTANTGDINNAGALLQGNGLLDLQADGTIYNNAGGQMIGNGIKLAAGDINNQGGAIWQTGSDSAVLTAANRIDNLDGTIAAKGASLTIAAKTIDNSRGKIQHSGTASFSVTANELLKNDAGLLISKADTFTIQAGSLLNTNSGSQNGIQHAGTGSLTIGADTVNNNAGLLATNGQLQVTAGSITNQDGRLEVQKQAVIRASSGFDNTKGSLLTGALNLSAQGDLTNTGGKIQAMDGAVITAQNINNVGGQISNIGNQTALNVTAVKNLNNQTGFMGSNGDLRVSAAHMDDTANHLAAQGNLSLSVSDDFINRGTLAVNGGLDIQAASITNTAAGIINAKQTSLTAQSSIMNAGRLEGNQLSLVSQSLTNTGTIIGGKVTLTANTINNQGQSAVIAATDFANLWVKDKLMNQDGATIVTLGDLNVAANKLQDAKGLLVNGTGLVTNKAATIDVGGNFNLAAATVQNLAGGDPVVGTRKSTSTQVLTMAPHIVYNYLESRRGLGKKITQIKQKQFGGRDKKKQHNGYYVMLSTTVPKANVISYDAAQKQLTFNDNTAAGTVLVNGPAFKGYLTQAELETFFAASDHNKADYQILPTYQGTSNRGENIGTIAGPAWAGKENGKTTAYCSSVEINGNGDYVISFYPGYIPGVTLDPGNSRTASLNGSLPNAAEERRTLTTTTETQYIIEAPVKGQIKVGQNFGLNISRQFTNQYSQVAVGNAVVGTITTLQNQDYRLQEAATTIDQSNFRDYYWKKHRLKSKDYRSASGKKTFGPYTSTTYIAGGIPATFTARTIAVSGNNVANIDQSSDGVGGAKIGATLTAPATGSLLKADQSSQVVAVAGQAPGVAAIAAGQVGGSAATQVQNTTVAVSRETVAGSQQAGTVQVASDGKALNTTVGQVNSAEKIQVQQTQTGVNTAPVAGNQQTNPLNQVSGGTDAAALHTGQVGAALPIPVDTPENSKLDRQQAGQNSQKNLQSVDFSNAGSQSLLSMPQSGLYKTNTAPTAKYIVETNPRFASYKNFISSDYLLKRLNYNPEMVQKRLGDAYYEQKLVYDQIVELTGRRYLTGFADNDAQYKALMDNGVSQAQRLQLVPGVALSAGQLANLTQDIVWMVEKEVALPDGTRQTVLVPQVYLCQSNAIDLTATGALIAADTVDFKLAGNVTNTGTIAGTKQTSIVADNLLNQNGGEIGGTGNTSLAAATDILNQGGTITGNQVVVIAGRDIKNETATHAVTASIHNGRHSWTGSNTIVGPQAAIDATGSLTVAAGRDIAVTGAAITAVGDTTITAGRDLTVGTVIAQNKGVETEAHHAFAYTDRQHVTSSITGKQVAIASQGDTHLSGAAVSAAGGLTVAVQGNLTVDAVKNIHIEAEKGKTRGSRVARNAADETIVGSSLEAAKDITVTALNPAAGKGNIRITASEVNSNNGTITIAADKAVTIQTDTETHESLLATHTKSHGMLSSTTKDTRDYSLTHEVKGSTVSGEQVNILTNNDLTVRGSNIVGTKDVNLAAKGNIDLESAKETGKDEHYQRVKKSGVLSGGGLGFTIGKQSTTTTLNEQVKDEIGSTVGSINGNVHINAGNNINSAGTTFVSGKDLNITGKEVNIDNTVNTYDSQYKYEFKQSGLSVSLGSTLISAASDAAADINRAGDVQDSRLKALYEYKAVKDMQKAGKELTKNNGKLSGGAAVSVSIGSSKTTFEQTTHTETAN
ncbi:filamentous hemagglutinin N-terminal domain-containing protein, partial [Sporomusa acidovorans]